MNHTLLLVACSKSKLPHAAPARDLYTGNLFRLSREYAEMSGHRWAILSARHGVVAPEAILEPYSLCLRDLDTRRRDGWSDRVLGVLRALIADGGITRVIFLAGRDYRDELAFRLSRYVEVVQPFEGTRGIGDLLRWLTVEVERLRGAEVAL